MKKLLSVFTAVCITAFFAISVSAATVYVNDYFKYTVESKSVTIVGYYGQDTEVTVPSMIAGNPVNTIASGAFSECTNVTKIILPDTIMTIKEGAFRTGQSVTYLDNSSNNNSDSKTDSTSSTNSSSVEGGLQKGDNQGTEGTTQNQNGQTNTSSSADASQPSNGVDEQETSFASEDADGQENTQSLNENNAEKQTQNHIWLGAASVLAILIAVGAICFFVCKKRR